MGTSNLDGYDIKRNVKRLAYCHYSYSCTRLVTTSAVSISPLAWELLERIVEV